ncbi:MAG: ABC transporter permease subunit [Anaerolineales bacterium]|nr:ABC transporter permease subunit [Anaerolineales bacterium]
MLVIANILIIRGVYNAEPVALSPHLAPNGQPTALGSFILAVTHAQFLTWVIVGLWLVGVIAVIYGAGRHHWPGPAQWLKDKLFTGFFSALVTLALVTLIIFAIRGILAWTVFGALFVNDPAVKATLEDATPGAIWGIVGANLKLFAVGQYPAAAIWRVWASLGLVLVLSALSSLAWGLGSPLKALRRPLFWLWIASLPIIYLFLSGIPDTSTGPWQEAPTNRWGGFLLTVVIAVIGIVASFPIGLLLALGRRSQVRGVPWLWVWGAVGLLLYWMVGDFTLSKEWPFVLVNFLGNFPDETVTWNIPIIFRDPPIWTVELSPLMNAAVQAVIIVGLCWIVGRYLQGNLIKTFCIAYIEIIRGVPFITVLFMAQVMLPIFLPKGLEIDNLLRVIVGTILFSAAYLAENVRGGLQAIPRGQYEAASAIGLSTAQSMRLIILPQALRAVIPALVGQFISLFKDTSLIAIVGLFELLGIAQIVVAQPEWFGLQRETFVFVALVYWICAFSMSSASRNLERKLGVGKY